MCRTVVGFFLPNNVFLGGGGHGSLQNVIEKALVNIIMLAQVCSQNRYSTIVKTIDVGYNHFRLF